MKDDEHGLALRLLRQHPGWSDRRVAAEISYRAERGRRPSRDELRAWLDDSPSWWVTPRAVCVWRNDAGLAPTAPSSYKPPRRQAVRLGCRHAGYGCPRDDGDPRAWCWRCRHWVPLARPDERRDLVEQALLDQLRDEQPPDTAPPDPTPPHFVDRPAGDVARDLLDRLRHGPLPSDPRERLAEILRRDGMSREEAERIATAAVGARKRRESRREARRG